MEVKFKKTMGLLRTKCPYGQLDSAGNNRWVGNRACSDCKYFKGSLGERMLDCNYKEINKDIKKDIKKDNKTLSIDRNTLLSITIALTDVHEQLDLEANAQADKIERQINIILEECDIESELKKYYVSERKRLARNKQAKIDKQKIDTLSIEDEGYAETYEEDQFGGDDHY